MIRDKKFYSIIFICFLLGFMISVQVRTAQENVKTSTQYQRIEKLSDMLLRTEQERDELKAEIVRLKEDGNLRKEFPERINFLAGTTAVKGPGVVVSIEDSKKIISNSDNTNLYIIHDEDILRIVNELRAGGAEALAINDQRLIGTSEIRCSGPTITVNGKVYGAPFTVKAIGDPKTLNSALTMRGGIVDSLKHWGIKVTIKEEPSIAIPAFTGSYREEHLQSNELGGKE